MSALGQQEMNFGRFISPDEIIAEVDAVSVEDVQRLANEIFRPEAMAVTLLGSLGKFRLDRSQLQC
jgi:predicted Zn-dependent peptidase